jgi:DUF2924 family protein
MDLTAISAIEELQHLKIPALKKRYRELFGEESKSSNKQFLFRRIAWRLQANAEGDLSERARRRAAEIANEAALSVRETREQLDVPEVDWEALGEGDGELVRSLVKEVSYHGTTGSVSLTLRRHEAGHED